MREPKYSNGTTSSHNHIDCPWCGETITDLWDFPLDKHVSTECGHCERPIKLWGETSVSWTALADTKAARAKAQQR